MILNSDTLPKIRGEYKFNEPMARHTWLNTGGNAQVMFLPQDKEDLQYFLQHIEPNIPLFILGGGSNLLVRDGGMDGVVIKLQNPNFSQIRQENDLLCCGAGLKNSFLKKFLIEHSLGGLEFICSIPGTIGGLVRSNAGCFGSELVNVLEKAEVMDRHGNIFQVEPSEFHFAYRHSDFSADWIILELMLKTQKSSAEEVSRLIAEQAEYRRTHQPQNVRTAGSTFKNPPEHRAWELIKKVGGTELKIGGASFSPQHCNFLINDGTASAEDIENLGNTIVKKVKEQENITLEWEVKIIGKRK